MKKSTLLYLFVLFSLVCSSAPLLAQTESKGDTLIIGPMNSEEIPLGSLNEAIHGDTLENGERIHRVYKLYRNLQYILTDVIKADFPLKIVADKPDKNNRPPVIRCGLDSHGSTVDNWWHIYDNAHFENLWLSGINLDGSGPISWIAQIVESENKTISYKGCIVEFPYTWWATFADWGENNTYKIENCIFMNIGNPIGATWNGAIFNGGTMDSIIYRNTTFYNFGCFATNSTAFYVGIDHCSFINCMMHPVNSHKVVIREYTNNLWVNCHAFSDDQDEIKKHYDNEGKGLMNYADTQWEPQELDSLYGPGGIYSNNYDPNGDVKLTVDEQVWTLRNNAWYYTKPITDGWAEYNDVIPNTWMNNYNRAMFDNQNSTWLWTLVSYKRDTNDVIIDSSIIINEHRPFKYFTEENTYNINPGIVDMNGTDKLLASNCFLIRCENYAMPCIEPVNWHGVDNYLAFTWPLDFDLSYTNHFLQYAGDNCYPLGDFHHWFPEVYWWYWDRCAIEINNTISDKFILYGNFPNPFNPVTNIKYDINKSGHVTLTIHNVLGKKVKSLVDRQQSPGSYSVQWDGSNELNEKVASGVYFYRLQQGEQVQIQKMMLVK